MSLYKSVSRMEETGAIVKGLSEWRGGVVSNEVEVEWQSKSDERASGRER